MNSFIELFVRYRVWITDRTGAKSVKATAFTYLRANELKEEWKDFSAEIQPIPTRLGWVIIGVALAFLMKLLFS